MFAVILSVPRITPIRPSLAPAIIKALMTKHGKDSHVMDLNIDFYNNFSQTLNKHQFDLIDKYLYSASQDSLDTQSEQALNQWIDCWIDKILDKNPEHILISVFTWHAQKFTQLLLQRLRPRTSSKIIVGGQGIGEVREQTSWIGTPLFAKQIRDQGLIDHWIKGDAETTIPLLCKGVYQGKGIDNDDYSDWAKLNENIIPDFSDHDVMSYHSGAPQGTLPAEFSRGCVRSCNFCDWVTSGGGFRTKTGEQVFNEVKNYYETFGVRHIYFNDALINGSIKEFNEFNRLLLNYYQENNLPDRHIIYSGHFIIRGPGQGWKQEYIELMGRAGADSMVVGVESGSDSVKKSMNKGYTTKDLDFNMEGFVKYNIKLYMLMMVGFPTETDEDFKETLDLVSRYQKYVATGNISGINFGQTFIIEEGAPIFYHPEELDLQGVGNQAPHDVFWINPKNPQLTYKKRILRRIQAQELAVKLGYPIWRADSQLKWLMNKYNEIINGTYNAHKTRIQS